MLSIVNLFDVDQKTSKVDNDDEKIHRIVIIIIIRNIVSETDCKIQHKQNCRSKEYRELKFFTENRN